MTNKASSRSKHWPKHRLVLVDGDDWQGLYVDGKLYEEGRHVDLVSALDRLHIFKIKEKTPDQEWLEDRGSLPENLADCVLEEK